MSELHLKLTSEELKRYNLMIETVYVLLMCDERAFIETDENGRNTISTSWLLSVQPFVEMLGFNLSSYAQGSISANRLFYELLKDNSFNNYNEVNIIFERLKNLISLRRDDSALNSTKLFGSSFEIHEPRGLRVHRLCRKIDVSLRHSSAALYILSRENENNTLSPELKESLDSFYSDALEYIYKAGEWNKDELKHVTLSSIIKLCESINFSNHDIIKQNFSNLKKRCESLLLEDNDCIVNKYGNYYWNLPETKKNTFQKYEYYINLFVLIQQPYLIEKKEAQGILKRMIKNKVRVCDNKYYGIPLHGPECEMELQPDFGTSSSILYLLLYSIINDYGDINWKEYCKEEYNHLLKFCLYAFDKEEYYLLACNENIARALFLPFKKISEERQKQINEFIQNIKDKINKSINNGIKLNKIMKKIEAPKGLEIVKAIIIDKWQINKYWTKKDIPSTIDYSEFGELLAGLFWGTIKSLGR